MAANRKVIDRDLDENTHLVLSVTELDRMVYQALRKQGAAKPPKKGASSYEITDREAAASVNILPKVLNPLGAKGWNLLAVNKMECYIFTRGDAVEYRIETPAGMDRAGLNLLKDGGHLKLEGFEGQTPKLEITNSREATIQKVMPKILSSLSVDGWQLCAINGPQLYFFSRPINA